MVSQNASAGRNPGRGRLGATPVSERVVYDGKYVTAAGVSAGIDMGLALAGRIAGDEVAQAIQQSGYGLTARQITAIYLASR